MPRLWHNGSPRLTCDNACHLRRGSKGGEDWAMAVGTPLYAPFDGTYRFHVAGTGGYTVTGIPSDSRLKELVAQVMHLSKSAGLVLGGASKFYREGTLLAYSGGRPGAPGAGSSTGPHEHAHGIISGKRGSMTTAISWARAQLAPKPTPTGDTDMLYLFTRDRDGTGTLWTLFNTATGKEKSTRSQATANRWALGFGPAKTVDVDVYIETRAIIQELAQTVSAGADVAPVLARLEELEDKIDAIPTTYVGQPKGA